MNNYLTSIWNSDANKNVGAIQTKRKELEEKNNPISENKNDVVKFASSIGYNILSTILIMLVGCNFIFYTSLDDISKQTLFPINSQQYYPDNYDNETNPLLSNKKVGGMNDCKSKEKFSIGNLGNTVRKMGIPPNTGWPYSMIDDTNLDFSLQGFKNWYGISVAEIMINMRKLLLKILNFFDKEDRTIFSKDIFQILFSNIIFTLIPLALPVLLPVIFIIFFVMSCYTAWKHDKTPFHLLFFIILFFGPAMFLSGGVMVTSFIQFLFTFILLPLFLNQDKLKNILKCNIDLFTYIFGALCVSSAITHLDSNFGNVALIIYMIALLRRLYKLYK